MKKAILFFSLFTLLFYKNQVIAQSPRPNFVIEIADDMRWDSFQPTGGPSWFNVPSINSLAEEGINFKNSFNVYSLCVPARSTIFTGLYAHSNGAVSNTSNYLQSLPTFAAILDTAGYHCAYVGKYHVYTKPQPGYEYWLVIKDDTHYIDATYNYNHITKIIPGHVEEVLNDSAMKWMTTVDTPFMIVIAHQAPHKTVVPEDKYAYIYSAVTIPFPPTFYPYSKYYPSFLYERPTYKNTPEDTDRLHDDYEKYFEGVQSIEGNITNVISLLKSRGIYDNTFLLFTTDNGAMYGEHLLAGKSLAYEPSIRIPLFIRYPKWFPPNTIFSSSFALNLDIAPTIVDAAGIDYTKYGFQGVSLHSLVYGDTSRNMFLYENIKLDNTEVGDTVITPSIRCIRTMQYKFVRYHCMDSADAPIELFDVLADPNDDSNLAYEPQYASLVATMSTMLDSLRMVLHDTLTIDTFYKDCFLALDPPFFQGGGGGNQLVPQGPGKNFMFNVLPNPVNDQIKIHMLHAVKGTIEVGIFDPIGQQLFTEKKTVGSGAIVLSYDASKLQAGVYSVRVSQNGVTNTQFVLKQ